MVDLEIAPSTLRAHEGQKDDICVHAAHKNTYYLAVVVSLSNVSLSINGLNDW